jgi:hypothetical protein
MTKPRINHRDPVEQSGTVAQTALSEATINFRQMAKDAAKIQEYIANGGKSRGVNTIKPSGLFNNR